MAIIGNTVQTMGPYNEALASLPDVTRRKYPGDGTEPGGTALERPMDASQTTGLPADQQSPSQFAPVVATLEGATPDIQFRTVEQLVRSQDRLAKNRWAIDTHFDRIRTGIPFSRLEKIPNQSIWVAKLPNGMTKESAGAVPNKADDLCNKVEDTLMADPAKPDAKKHVNDESARAAAELANEFLTIDGGESGTNDTETYRWGLNNAFSRSASILHYILDRSGGGYQPLRKLAHPEATDPANPLVVMRPIPGALPDPMTGEVPQMSEESPNPILRFVSAPTPEAPAGQFVDSADQADRVWLPKIKIERMRREQIRCFPAQATPEDADAVVLIRYMTLADARKEWPDTVGQMTAERLGQLANWKPPMAEEYIVPFAFRGLQAGQTGTTLDEAGMLSPLLQRRMFSYRLYCKASPDYADGYVLDLSGAAGGTVLAEGNLGYTVPLPRGGRERRCREIPIAMVRPMQDVAGGDPLGWAFVSRFAGSSEAEATIWAAALDRLDNELHPHVLIRSLTAIDDDDWANRTQPIMLGPNDPEPTYELFPPFPPVLPLVERLDQKNDVMSGLTATAQGLETNTSVSGVSKQLSVRQALISLSGFQQNLHNAMQRGWRLKCQIVQAEFTTPQLLEYAGEDSSSEPLWWTGENFAGVDRIGIQPGTGTMMTPEGKAQYVAFLQGQNWVTNEVAAEVALPGIRMDLGIPENPGEAALERSVGLWLKGPPDGWVEAKQHEMMAAQQAQAAWQASAAQAQAMGQPVAPFVPSPSQLPTPFPVRPNDNEPSVATATVKRLSKLMFDPRYSDQPPEWQAVVNETYQRAVGYVQASMQPAMPAQPQPGSSAPAHPPQASPGTKPMPAMPKVGA